MECRAVVSSLSDYIDMWLSESEVREIESHLVACPKCQTISLELNQIRSTARDLALHTPSRALWGRIAEEIRLENAWPEKSLPEMPLIDGSDPSERPELNWWQRLNARRFTFTLPQLASISAFVAAFVIMVMYGTNISTRRDFDISNGPRALQTALLPNEERIKADLEQKMSVINLRKANWDPDVRAEFERHLNKIELSLRNSREMLQSNPDDGVQQQMVLTLYDEKRQLLEDVERLNW
jgi:putative zinc finger protein